MKKTPTLPALATLHRAALAAAVLLGASLCAGQAAAQSIMGKGADIKPLCGTKPTVVALVDGFGGNIWRKVTRAEFEDEAKRCPNVTKVLYAEANADQQKYNSAINSMVAQGANIIVTFTDFGDAGLPAVRKAYKDGVTVVPYYSQISGTAGKDFAANVYVAQAKVGAAWAEWIGQTLKSGNVVVLGGVPGAQSSQQYMNGFKEGIKKYPDIKLLDESYIITNWNPADAQRAVSGLLAKYKKIDAIASDYGVTTLAGIKAFEQAGLPVPPQATIGSFNELNCKYLDAKKSSKPWKYFTMDGTNTTAGFALRRAMAIYQGTKNDEPLSAMPYVYADSEKKIDPECDPKAPLDADFTSGLPRDKLSAIFKQ